MHRHDDRGGGSIVVYAAVRWWHKSKESPWRGILERGLSPIAVGLVFAGALAVLEAAHVAWYQVATTLIAAALLIWTRVGPYSLMAAAAVLYGGVTLYLA